MLGEYRITGRGAAAIAASVESGVGTGELVPGQLLPPLRELAADLGVNANTVAAAYRTLRERGVIETAGRRGSRVRPRPASTPREAHTVDVPSHATDISQGNPDVALLPPLREALAFAAERAAEEPGLYGAPAVDARLAEAARAAFDADGVPEGPVGVASGSLDAIERVLAAHLRPGDSVGVEDPGWGALLDLIPALGLRAVPVAVDDEGPLPEEVARVLRQGARALIVTDRAQNPTGAAVTAARAAALRETLADHPRTLLVEDDHGHGIVDLPLHPIAGVTGSGGRGTGGSGGGPGGSSGVTEHWALVRSTAKAYGPDLRLAVLTGDRVTLARVGGRQRLGPGWVSRLLQDAVSHLWRTGAVDTVAVARAYARRRDPLVDALTARGVRAYGRSGMNVWVPVPDETAAVTRLLGAGWAVAPGARFRLASPPGVRLTVSPLTPADTGPLADAVAAAVRPGGEARRYE